MDEVSKDIVPGTSYRFNVESDTVVAYSTVEGKSLVSAETLRTQDFIC